MNESIRAFPLKGPQGISIRHFGARALFVMKQSDNHRLVISFLPYWRYHHDSLTFILVRCSYWSRSFIIIRIIILWLIFVLGHEDIIAGGRVAWQLKFYLIGCVLELAFKSKRRENFILKLLRINISRLKSIWKSRGWN